MFATFSYVIALLAAMSAFFFALSLLPSKSLLSEQLEERRVLSTIQVTSTVDLPQPMNGGSNPVVTGTLITLRSAIQAADATAGPTTIDLPAGTYTPSVASAILPRRTESALATGRLTRMRRASVFTGLFV